MELLLILVGLDSQRPLAMGQKSKIVHVELIVGQGSL